MVEFPAHFRGAPMGEATISRAERSRHQRDRVISMVTPVFARRGYQGTTVDDLLAAAKVGVGNFYSLFTGKEDCFLACLDQVVSEARRGIDDALAGASDWDSGAYLALAAALDRLADGPLGARLVLVEAQSAGPAAIDRYDALLDLALAGLRSGRLVHSEAADLPASFEEASMSGLAFYLQRCLLEGPLPSARQLLGETADLLLGPMIGAEKLAALARERIATAPD
jgi:AcrR family transcriptional regulator